MTDYPEVTEALELLGVDDPGIDADPGTQKWMHADIRGLLRRLVERVEFLCKCVASQQQTMSAAVHDASVAYSRVENLEKAMSIPGPLLDEVKRLEKERDETSAGKTAAYFKNELGVAQEENAHLRTVAEVARELDAFLEENAQEMIEEVDVPDNPLWVRAGELRTKLHDTLAALDREEKT